jgi:hypothetical protein
MQQQQDQQTGGGHGATTTTTTTTARWAPSLFLHRYGPLYQQVLRAHNLQPGGRYTPIILDEAAERFRYEAHVRGAAAAAADVVGRNWATANVGAGRPPGMPPATAAGFGFDRAGGPGLGTQADMRASAPLVPAAVADTGADTGGRPIGGETNGERANEGGATN